MAMCRKRFTENLHLHLQQLILKARPHLAELEIRAAFQSCSRVKVKGVRSFLAMRRAFRKGER